MRQVQGGSSSIEDSPNPVGREARWRYIQSSPEKDDDPIVGRMADQEEDSTDTEQIFRNFLLQPLDILQKRV